MWVKLLDTIPLTLCFISTQWKCHSFVDSSSIWGKKREEKSPQEISFQPGWLYIACYDINASGKLISGGYKQEEQVTNWTVPRYSQSHHIFNSGCCCTGELHWFGARVLQISVTPLDSSGGRSTSHTEAYQVLTGKCWLGASISGTSLPTVSTKTDLGHRRT